MRTRHYLIVFIVIISLTSFVISIEKFVTLKDKISYVVENLDKARFNPIRGEEWQHDYGFTNGGVLNKYEYIRSLFSYEDCQSMLDYPIFLSGPHTIHNLNINSKYKFGHYNPKFVSELRINIKDILSNNYFIKYTKPIIEKYDILPLIKSYKNVYDITVSNQEEFQNIKSEYINGLKNQNWPEGGYRNSLPDIISTEPFWNWGETSYHFWIRRDIDNTKEIWIEIINDILKAYDYQE